jgi:carboxymethylenebutenolidase
MMIRWNLLMLLLILIFKAVKTLEEKLKASGIPYEVHIYPGNAHAFMNRSLEGVKRRKDMGMPDEDEASSELAGPDSKHG